MGRKRRVPLVMSEGAVDTRQFLGPRPPRLELVYYIQRDGLVKIGHTACLRTRMKSLRPDELLAIEPGTRDLETQRHRQFAAFRAGRSREWFKPAAQLLGHIDERRSVLLPPDLAPLLKPPSHDYEACRFGHLLRPPNVGGVRGGGLKCKTCLSTAMTALAAGHARRRFDREGYRARKYAEIMTMSEATSEDVAS